MGKRTMANDTGPGPRITDTHIQVPTRSKYGLDLFASKYAWTKKSGILIYRRMSCCDRQLTCILRRFRDGHLPRRSLAMSRELSPESRGIDDLPTVRRPCAITGGGGSKPSVLGPVNDIQGSPSAGSSAASASIAMTTPVLLCNFLPSAVKHYSLLSPLFPPSLSSSREIGGVYLPTHGSDSSLSFCLALIC